MTGYAPLHLLLVFMLLAAPLQPLLASPDSGHPAAASHDTQATCSDSNEQSHHGGSDCKGAGHACGMCGTHCPALTPAILSSAFSALPNHPVASPLTFINTGLSPLYEPPRPA